MTKEAVIGCLAIAMLSVNLPAAEPAPPQSQPDNRAITVAVLDYEGALPGNPQLGHQVSDILAVRLSLDAALTIVERARLGEVLDEHKLALSGLVDPDKAVEAGRLLGARLLVTGKAFMLDNKLMIVTKVIGVETGQLKGTLRQVDLTSPLSDAIALLGQDVGGLIHREAARLLPADVSLVDPLVKLKEQLARLKPSPKVAVVVAESHRGRAVIDPAVQTEISRSLTACGVVVVDAGGAGLADWARRMLKGDKPPWPGGLDQADYVIVGEAFSEFAMRSGDLVTCAARGEINLIERKGGRVVLADRDTRRAVDLAEGIAAKTALQKVGWNLGLAALRYLAKSLPAAAEDKTSPSKPSPAGKGGDIGGGP